MSNGCWERLVRAKLRQAFSILELLVTLGIVGLLLAVSIPLSGVFREQARKAKCISHMRTIHSGLSAHLLDKGQWPQMEEGRFDFSDDDFFRFWVIALEPYGVGRDTWLCPSDRSEHVVRREIGPDTYYGSYVVTRFDKHAATPHRWNQPWLMERGNFHGKGAHIVMPDGSIQDAGGVFHGR